MGIQDGSEKATEELYRLVQPGLHWFLARKLGDSDDALDGVQHVLLALIQNIRHGKLRQPENLKSYTLTIARRYSENVIRRRMKERTHISDFDYLSSPDAKPTPERSIVERQ